ncbi:MAG: hypothetical protein WAL98_09375 [Desulfatiglandaceae bacterium]|jgi:hypothetical protein
MKNRNAVVGFSQSEKIKAGLIWASQILQVLEGLPEAEKRGGAKTAGALVGMIHNEIQLVQNLSGDTAWGEIRSHVDRARVMIDSGVPAEAIMHLTQALSKTTSMAGSCMTCLKDEGLI